MAEPIKPRSRFRARRFATSPPRCLYFSEMHAPIEGSYRLLGLHPGCGRDELKSAFRRLVRRFHPDVAGRDADPAKLAQAVSAYRLLSATLRASDEPSPRGVCERCGRRDELLPALAGDNACPACLLGQTRWRRVLTGPTLRAARHLSVVALYAASSVLLVRYLNRPDPALAIASAAGAFGGLLLLGLQVGAVIRSDRPRKSRRTSPPRGCDAIAA